MSSGCFLSATSYGSLLLWCICDDKCGTQGETITNTKANMPNDNVKKSKPTFSLVKKMC